MKERELRGLINKVKHGKLSRRGFISRMVMLGLTAPLASQMLLSAGVAQAQSAMEYKPTKAGGGGTLKLLWWQGPTLLNPHFATGTKDQDGSRIFYEPLAAWAPDGALIPILAAEIPSRENGGLSEDGKSITWKLKQGVTWHDGKPFTADDCVFNWEYGRDPATASVTSGTYRDVEVEKVDSHTVKVMFKKPTPFWADAFVGNRGCLIPKHLFAEYAGAKSREAPANLAPVGTGPYKFVEFKPGDLVRGERNTNYHIPNKPYFDAIEMKGGGDAVSAARAVIQTGEYDYAWNMQVEDSILKRLEDGGRGRVVIFDGGSIEHIQLNNTDPWTEVEGGERSSMKTKHPLLTDPAVRQALNLLVDRQSVQDHIYGRGGVATRNFLNNPPAFRSKNTTFEFNIDKAIKILEDGGWKVGSDGIREKGGKKLKMVYQTSINAPRQKTQAIVKQACQKAGIDLELKSITASVYFSSDVGNPDTYTKFYCDIQMYTTTQPQPDPALFMNQFTTWEISTMENKWQGRNITRWYNEEYDKLYRAAEGELDPVKRAALFIAMNDLVIGDQVVIPVVFRPGVGAASNKLHLQPSGWDSTLWNLGSWYRDA
ncbi:MAG: peptide ABC transporter substrate-binding protein [Oceanibaculum nanhaiense]|uniref:peptide ABC transporter substrate-binding protein n=1 Tax=Oceanibaculum nanhaiense TaxID=1909734 RepID=UPI0025A37A19|nr:peptide ABC transporter substrate-binding protein [Oceanibaculum nanhaiense]MDM7945592.1 peptide ABC transporter substrate-binding protein [Oceanibaculum nanhaiense]